jgi:hypothetical protein
MDNVGFLPLTEKSYKVQWNYTDWSIMLKNSKLLFGITKASDKVLSDALEHYFEINESSQGVHLYRPII